VPQDYVEDPKVENLEEPKLSQRASSYNSYCESYFDTINELTDVMQGLGVEFDKLSKKICEEEKAEGKSEEPQKNLETSKKLEEQASEEVEEKEQKDELDLLVSDAQSEGEEESKSEIDQPKSSAEIVEEKSKPQKLLQNKLKEELLERPKEIELKKQEIQQEKDPKMEISKETYVKENSFADKNQSKIEIFDKIKEEKGKLEEEAKK